MEVEVGVDGSDGREALDVADSFDEFELKFLLGDFSHFFLELPLDLSGHILFPERQHGEGADQYDVFLVVVCFKLSFLFVDAVLQFFELAVVEDEEGVIA